MAYIAVASPKAADLGNYYELVNGEYVKTEDESITANKTYYIYDYTA